MANQVLKASGISKLSEKWIDNGDGTFSRMMAVNAPVGQIGIFNLAYDYMGATYPNATTEVYTTRVGGATGSIQQTATVVYSDSSKAQLTSVTRA